MAGKEELTRALAPTDDEGPDSNTSSHAARDQGRPVVKARKARSSTKVDKPSRAPQRRGKLYQIVDMPLDVLMEVRRNQYHQ